MLPVIIAALLITAGIIAADAHARRIAVDGKPYGLNNGAAAWFFTVALLPVVGVPMYIYKRTKTGAAPARPAGRTKVCPSCAETIQAAAVKCRFCGESFATARPRQVAR